MTLVFHDGPFDEPPAKARGREGTVTIYGRNADGSLKHHPPFWTMRGWLEINDAPVARQQYDSGNFEIPSDPVDREELRRLTMVEFHRVYGTLSIGVLGKLVEYDGCVIHIYICSHPHFDRKGFVGKYLNSLSRFATHIFPEVLPASVMPGMLERRGFHKQWIADTDDDLGTFFPCYVREGKST